MSEARPVAPASGEGAGGAPASEPSGPGSRPRRPQRTHRGRTLDERRAQRRDALLDAALDLFGTKGYAATSIGELCKKSFVTTRYFYEEYGDRETLLIDLYEKLMQRVTERVAAIEEPPGPDHVRLATRRRIAAFVHAVTEDERAARVLLLESGSARLESRRRQAHSFFAKFVAAMTFRYVERGEVQPGHDYDLLALMFVGAVNETVTHWLLSDPADRSSLDHIIDALLEMYLLVRRGVEEPDTG